MGGAVSSGRDNNELIDNLMGGNYIRSRSVERVFRALDRADYMTPEARDQAYKDLAWRNGPLHMSAPCIYSEVMEGLELKPGLSFLNVGSGTGYLSTLVGLILGSGGINHGIEVHSFVVEYANKKMSQFLENSPTLDEFDYCEPKFYSGNGLCIAPLLAPYDRVYCGAGCPEEYQNFFKQLIKVGGVLVMPLNDNLLQVRRISAEEWSSRSLLNVSFATLRVPTKEEAAELIRLEEQTPPRLQVLSRAVVRAAMRASLLSRNPALRSPPPRQPPAKRACPRRICIPLEDDSDEGLNALHDLDQATGANEMNALLSLVLSMGHNRVAGALRFDPLDSEPDSPHSPRSSPSDDPSDDDDDDDDDDDADDDGRSDGAAVAQTDRPTSNSESDKETNLKHVLLDIIKNEEADNGDTPTPSDAQTPKDPQTSKDSPTQSEDSTSERRKISATRSNFRRSRDGKGRRLRESRPVEEVPDMPAEVEIYLGKTADMPSTSTMEWEQEDGKREHSSDEETTESTSKTKEEKRQKFDSGIGEENTPSSASSPSKNQQSDESDMADEGLRSGSLTDDEPLTGRRRLQKRGLGPRESSSSTEAEADDSSPRYSKRRGPEGPDARRVRLSILMKRGVKELPLPYALKKYVNLGRCFEF